MNVSSLFNEMLACSRIASKSVSKRGFRNANNKSVLLINRSQIYVAEINSYIVKSYNNHSHTYVYIYYSVQEWTFAKEMVYNTKSDCQNVYIQIPDYITKISPLHRLNSLHFFCITANTPHSVCFQLHFKNLQFHCICCKSGFLVKLVDLRNISSSLIHSTFAALLRSVKSGSCKHRGSYVFILGIHTRWIRCRSPNMIAR